MTEQEARGYIKGKLDCMNECGAFNREDSENTDWCDDCHYCYSQGNFGQQKEAFLMAINALEKQIAKKAIYDNYHRAGYRCQNCNNTNPFGYKYCKYCGQKQDWRDSN